MLDTLVNFFEWFTGGVESLFSFISSVVTGLFNIIKSLPVVLELLTSSIGFLPSTLVAFATITITISIVYLLVGRETGG